MSPSDYSGLMTDLSTDNLNRLRNTVPSREAAEDLRRLALTMDGADADLLNRAADFLLEARQALKGGRRDVRGSRHWDSV